MILVERLKKTVHLAPPKLPEGEPSTDYIFEEKINIQTLNGNKQPVIGSRLSVTVIYF